ncbi:MAG TPA: ABC transporter permease [Rhizobiaceae bacterium]|nr:ABC transporter permease [Rhizobiaceae bacterium]
MTALILSIVTNPTVLAILLAIAGAFGWGVHQRRAGAKAERAKQAQREAKARDIRDEVDNDVGAMPPDEARKELGKWSRG